MKFFIKFDDETVEEGFEAGHQYDSIAEIIDDVSGWVGEEVPFEVYNLNLEFQFRFVWQNGSPVKSTLPRGLQKPNPYKHWRQS